MWPSRSLLVLGVLGVLGGTALPAQRPHDSAELPEFGLIGTGPDTVIILPCMSCRWTAWTTFMRMHADRFTFIAVTPPGFGGSMAPAVTPKDATDTPWRNNFLRTLSEFIDRRQIRRAVLLGHSWGTMIAVQLATMRPDVTRGIIAVDGMLESTTWLPADSTLRVSSAGALRLNNAPLDSNADAWSSFNRFQLPPDSALARSMVRDLLLLHGAFTATSRDALFGYWRENFLIDITSLTRALKIPILDVKCVWPGNNDDSTRKVHEATLQRAGIASRVRTVYMPNTIHHVMIHRPNALGSVVADFIATLPR